MGPESGRSEFQSSSLVPSSPSQRELLRLLARASEEACVHAILQVLDVTEQVVQLDGQGGVGATGNIL
jgi:hypothetical protein